MRVVDQVGVAGSEEVLQWRVRRRREYFVDKSEEDTSVDVHQGRGSGRGRRERSEDSGEEVRLKMAFECWREALELLSSMSERYEWEEIEVKEEDLEEG